MDSSRPTSPSVSSQPSQEQLFLAYQKDLNRKEQNRKNQENFRNSQKNKILSLESQVQSLQSQLQQCQVLRPTITSPISPSSYSQLDHCRADLASRDSTILQLQSQVQQLQSQVQFSQLSQQQLDLLNTYNDFFLWISSTHPQVYSSINPLFVSFTQQRSLSQVQPVQGISNVHLT
jgi:hypothetical protein